MRKYIISFALLLCSSWAFGVQSIVQYVASNGSTNGSGVFSLTITSSGAGHGFLVWGDVTGATAGTPTISDSGSETYTNIISSATGCYVSQFTTNACVVAYLCNSASGITSVSVTTSTFTGTSLHFIEFSGTATSTCLDTNSLFSTGIYSASPWASASITAAASDLVIGLASNSTTAGTPLVVNGSWTNANAASGGASANNCNGSDCNIMEYQLSVSAGSIAAGGTTTGGTGAAMIVGFKDAGGGGASVPNAHAVIM